MLDNGRISSTQLLFILLILEGASAILYTPSRVAALAGPDSWLAVSLGDAPYGLLVILVAIALGKRFPTKTFTEYLPVILGKVPGKLLAGVCVLIFLHLGSLSLNEASSFVQLVLLNLTPVTVVETVLAMVAIYGAYLGIEVIARQNEIVLPLWMLMVFLLLGLAAKEIDLDNLKPVLENGLLPVLSASLFHCGWRGEGFLLLMLYPYLNQKQEALKTGLLYLGSAVALSGIIHAVVVGALGDLFAAHEIYAFDELVSYISVGDFIERVEMLVCVAMIPAFLIKMALIYHSAGIAAANTLGLKNYRATLIPIALITIILSQVLFGTQLQLFNFLFYVWPIEAVIVELALPALILLIAVIRKKADPEASGNRSSKSAPGSAQGTPALAGGEHFANP